MDKGILPIGTKNGCFTIIGDFDDHIEKAKDEIIELENEREKLFNGDLPPNPMRDGLYYKLRIDNLKADDRYLCQCKCGKIHHLSATALFSKRHRYCGKDCGLIERRWQKFKDACPREKHASYYYDLLNTNFESLEILECVDDNYEGEPMIFNKNKLGAGICYIYKLYKCRCYICGKEYKFTSDEFIIHNDEYGSRAKDGYYSDTCCDCHTISSFQWRTVNILLENHIKYKVEVSFPDLYGIEHKKLLRYDFAIFDDMNNLKCLIECQGEQHYKPVQEFGGINQFENQVKNDELKRTYAKEHNIPLIEIPFTCNTYEKEVKFLKQYNII